MRDFHNIERRTGRNGPSPSSWRDYPYRGWDANGTLYLISRPSARRTGWHAWGQRTAGKLNGDMISAPTLTALAGKLAAHHPPV